MRRVAPLVAALVLAGCFGGDEKPKQPVTISLPPRQVDREALHDALRTAHVDATIRSGAPGSDVRVAREDGSAEITVAWDEEFAGKLQGQGLADCLGRLEGQGVARVGTPSPAQRLGQTFVLEPLLEQDVLRPARDVRRADAVLAADDDAAAQALTRAATATVVVGRGATTTGVRNVIARRQCQTLFESPERLARATAAAAAALAAGDPAPSRPPRLAPEVITRDTIETHLEDSGFPSRADICAGALAGACRELGI